MIYRTPYPFGDDIAPLFGLAAVAHSINEEKRKASSLEDDNVVVDVDDYIIDDCPIEEKEE